MSPRRACPSVCHNTHHKIPHVPHCRVSCKSCFFFQVFSLIFCRSSIFLYLFLTPQLNTCMAQHSSKEPPAKPDLPGLASVGARISSWQSSLRLHPSHCTSDHIMLPMLPPCSSVFPRSYPPPFFPSAPRSPFHHNSATSSAPTHQWSRPN